MRPTTYIVDLDGVVFTHLNEGSTIQWSVHHTLLPQVRAVFDQWEKEGACIILMTARPECLRKETEESLRVFDLFWDQLIMGVTSGSRILINDQKLEDIDGEYKSAYDTKAYVLTRNKGLGCFLTGDPE